MKFIHEKASIEGDVELSDYVSIHAGAVLRGDNGKISIGEKSSVQDNCVIHDRTSVGKLVSIGHGAILHGCKIGDRVIIGINSTILNDAEIGNDVIIAAGSVVPPRKTIPPNSLVMGAPGKVVRELREDERKHIIENAEWYANKFCNDKHAPRP